MFAQAVNRAILEEEMASLANDLDRSPLSVRAYYLPKSDAPFTSAQALTSLMQMQSIYQRNTELPVVRRQIAISSSGLLLKTREDSAYGKAGTFMANATVGFLDGVEQHIAIADGEAWNTRSTGDVLNVWMHESFATEMGVHPGETYALQPIAQATPVTVRIAGLWSPLDANDAYWPASPNSTYRTLLLVSSEEYAGVVEPLLGSMPTASVHWGLDLDESQFVPEHAERYLEGLRRADVQVRQMLPDAELDVPVVPLFEAYLKRLRPLTLLLFGFSVPIIGFVLYFSALVSSIVADSERQVTAIIVSRGASDAQVLELAAIEGGLIVAIGTPLGIALGMAIARVMGYTTSFLRFGRTSPLTVSIAGLNGWLVALTVLVSLFARVYPSLAHRGQSVIAHAREVGRQLQPPFWQRYYLDLVLVLPTFYLVRQLALTGSIAIGKWRSSGDVFSDPVVFLVPALFVLTCALLIVRLLPLLLRILDRLFSGMLPVTPALTLQQLARRGSVYTSALLLIATMMAIGVFVASMAQSLDNWMGERVAYHIGSDIAFRVTEGPTGITSGAQAAEAGGYVEELEPARWLAPLEKVIAIPGVMGATWTGKYRATIPVSPSKLDRGWFMAVDRQTFPSAAYYRDDLSQDSLGELMNRLGAQPNGVLVSESLLARTGMMVGDTMRTVVSTDGSNSVPLDLVIVGTYRYFPTVYLREATVAPDGGERDSNTPGVTTTADTVPVDAELDTVVGNLDYLMSMGGGVATYNMWLRADRTTNPSALRRAIAEVVPYTDEYQDVWTLTEEEAARKERVGVYGVLTSGFAASLVLAAMGLLIQHRRALEDRLWRFAALRALGVSKRQVWAQVQLEYFAVLLMGLSAGGAIGVAAARVFVPFFRVTTSDGTLPLPPLQATVNGSSALILAGAFALVQVLIQVGLSRQALRSELFQVLRMGARE